jgi:hypothetical protein
VAGGREHCPVQKDRNADHVRPPVLYAVPPRSKAQPDRANRHHDGDDRQDGISQVERSLRPVEEARHGVSGPTERVLDAVTHIRYLVRGAVPRILRDVHGL